MPALTRLALYGGVGAAYRYQLGDGPVAFEFVSLTGVALSQVGLESNIVTLLGIASGGVAITITGDTGYGYSLNGGGFVTADGVAHSGDTIQVRVDSSANNNEGKGVILTVGSVIAPFSVTTLRAAPTTVNQTYRMRTAGGRR